MQSGCVIFDGPPNELTTQKALAVYGTEGDTEELKQAMGEGPVSGDNNQLTQFQSSTG
jgi:hypothetical protein